MNTFKDLYNFLELARNNRKYPESVANNIKSALKIFENELNQEEKKSIEMIVDNMEDIFLEVVNHNNEKGIASLSAYKARVLRIIKDYQRYGKEPSKIQNWEPKERKSTALLNNKDKKDKTKDKPTALLSPAINTPVDSANKIELALEKGTATMLLPVQISNTDAKKIKGIIDALAG